ncbi:alpha-2-macroglobulin family protein [Yoonia sp. 208BN28-4]|uniref:alpha-2-macroglobulin family protein n=1 Tax=Yoonia sp. 208BN28-4 TaxID=3126505 RepID=UPI00309C2610
MSHFARAFIAISAVFFAALTATAQTSEVVPDKRIIITRNVDFLGSDLANIFDTTLAACEAACLNDASCQAFTFNARSNACFPKRTVTEYSPYEGAISGQVYQTSPIYLQQAASRAADLDFLTSGDLTGAYTLAQSIGRDRSENSGLQRTSGARVAETDVSADWLAYASAIRTNSNSNVRGRMTHAAVAGYLRAVTDADRADALYELALGLEERGRGRTMIPALRLANDVSPSARLGDALDDAIGKYGFRVTDTQVESDSADPRICATFNEELVKAGVDYTPYVQLPDPALVVQVNDGQLCISGVQHGERYRIVLRQGLPAASGEVLLRPTDLTLYVRDRSPEVRFTSRSYVLPRLGDIAVPVETVNLAEVDLTLRRMSDRNLIRAMQEGYFNTPLYAYDEEYIEQRFAATVWEGTAQTGTDLNRDVLTRIPLQDVLAGEPAGIYVLSAAVPGADPYDNPPATQWFVLSDLGIATYLGVDGLTVSVRGLGDAAAKAGAEVTLLSDGNAVLGTATTDAQGVARFEAGLTRGLGVNAPALVTVADAAGDDAAFLSLKSAAFDLSDRGVEGREPAPPMDVFLATDRGAYRAGEIIHVTALMRDAQAGVLADVPLTAILTRPDGVEYSRTTSVDGMAGGHVFALPVASSAPRGTWRVALKADVDAPALASQSVLVEDFLPERIDFDLDLPDTITLGDAVTLGIEARYLFGPPAGDLGIEGEALLRAATDLQGFEGYAFGRYDAPIDAELTYLDGGRTATDGTATVDVVLPELSANQPLELRVTARVNEGSGRPVERQITTPVLPGTDMIGIKPLFDGVVGEGSSAEFQVIGLGPDLQAAPMDIQWTLNRVTTRYQWYSLYGDWNWEPVTRRERIATGTGRLGDAPLTVGATVDWGRYELVVERTGADYLTSAVSFYAGWYAPAETTDTPDLLQASLDAESYAIGDTANFRIVPRYAGTAVVTVMSNQLIAMQTVQVTEGENVIALPVTAEWGAGAYVSATVIRPMDADAGRNPARALGLGYAAVDPAEKALSVSIDAPETAQPRGPLDVAVQVDGVQAGGTAYVTLAAVDVGILNLTGFDAPDPSGHYFGQRKLGVEMRDLYGRLIDGMNGTMGTVRSGGDAMAGMSMQSPPPTEELVAYFEGPVMVGADGRATVSFDLPAFNGTVKLMAVAWSATGVGEAEADVLVRDPVVVTASVPRFLAPGDQSRMLLEIVHADGPAGDMGLTIAANGLALANLPPATITLGQGAKLVYAVPFGAFDTGVHDISVTLTTPDGQVLEKSLTVPVVANDPEVSRISRFTLASGSTFRFDSNVFDGMVAGTGHATLSVGALARFDAPGLLASLDRYPYGCTEQITSRAMPLLYLDSVAAAMGLGSRGQLSDRIAQSITEVLANQSANGAFGLWRAGSGDMWLDAYVTDFLSRARAEGHVVPDLAFRNAIDNLRNRVNYYPDFDSGGSDLAYAMMVLAREGAAAVGDLRYYADQKADAFSAVALAQLGSALAQYGDQRRADMLFGAAGRKLAINYATAERAIWRADYGTYRRDTAAVLALAVEAGSNAVDRDTLTLALAGDTGRASTQEASWTLLAANALIRDLRTEGITIDGQVPDGPILQVLEDDTTGRAIAVANASPRDTEITVTTFGVPSEEVPAGGNGYAIRREYFTTDGVAVKATNVAAGTRLVTVLTVTPFGRQEGRLMVNDPLPAGFEIDNPNLLQGGDIRSMDWLSPIRGENAEFRSDRFLAAVDWRSDNPFQLAYIVRAVSPGNFHHPAASVEDMYRPQLRARTDASRVVVTE